LWDRCIVAILLVIESLLFVNNNNIIHHLDSACICNTGHWSTAVLQSWKIYHPYGWRHCCTAQCDTAIGTVTSESGVANRLRNYWEWGKKYLSGADTSGYCCLRAVS